MSDWPAHDDCKSECWFAPTLRAQKFEIADLQATIARLTDELTEAREKLATLAAKGEVIGEAILQRIECGTDAALAARDKRVREETLNAANVYLTVQYGIMALGHHIDRDRILSRLDQPKADERLGRFGWHPDPVIDFEIEIEKLESRWHGAVHGLSKPGVSPETKIQVRDAISRAMEFVAGGREDGMAAKNRLRDLDRIARLDHPKAESGE